MTALAEFIGGHPLPWTTEEWLGLGELPAWPRIELIDGSLHVSPYAALDHQRACTELAYLLRGPARGAGLEVFAPANVILAGDTAVIPDVVVARAGLTGLAAHARDVLLVCEVESPSTRRMDRLTKADAYARAGIAQYWRVELGGAAGPVVCLYERDGDSYALAERVPAGSQLVTMAGSSWVEFDPAVLAR